MPNYIKPVPFWIDSPQKLDSILPDLDRSEYLSIDTESNSLYVYYEQVCLIQISIEHRDFLIDPLAIKDLHCLAKYFSNPDQKKIFHASEYDIICLKRDFGFRFINLFDTMIAARILGEEAVGLAALLKSRLGLELDKKYQRANWGMRPLSQEMLDYACQDSRFLEELHRILTIELQEKGLWDLAQEDFRLACEVEAHTDAPVPQTCWKVAGSTAITSSEAAILQMLCDLRESIASKQNIPAFKVIGNETLVTLIKNCRKRPRNKVHSRVSPRLADRQGAAILEILRMIESANHCEIEQGPSR
jgi:ribonuclease D